MVSLSFRYIVLAAIIFANGPNEGEMGHALTERSNLPWGNTMKVRGSGKLRSQVMKRPLRNPRLAWHTKRPTQKCSRRK